jgi:alpha/beta superfamily hydrolase
LLQNKNYHVIRYNSRGVGKSSGWPSFTGEAEGEDLKAVVQEFLAGKPEIDTLTIIVSTTEFYNMMHALIQACRDILMAL